VDEVIAGFASKTFTSVQLVTAYIARIAEINPTLNCVLEVNPDALKIAAGLDAERLMGISRGPLHGVPILIKDNIATFDKMNNTAGSFALLGNYVVPKSNHNHISRYLFIYLLLFRYSNLCLFQFYLHDVL
jgi:amidase